MICEIVNDYTKVYKKMEYGINACDQLQRLKALEYIQDKIETNAGTTPVCSNLSCINCGVSNEQFNYTCSPVTITSTGPNNLMAQLLNFDYCYNEPLDKYQLEFTFSVTYNNPSTINISFIDISLDTVLQTITNVSSWHPSGSIYKISGHIPNNGEEMYARIRVTDGSTNIDFPKQANLNTTKSLCLTEG